MGRHWRALDFIKVDIPDFHGRLHPEEFLDWLSAIEKFFDFKGILDFKDILETQWVKLVGTRFRGYASAWWDKVQEMHLRKGKSKISTWEKMKSRLKEKLLAAGFAQTTFSQFNNHHQEGKSVSKDT